MTNAANKHLNKVLSKLKRIGVKAEARTFAKYDSQGLMSSVFTLDSNKGKLIVHINTASFEQKRQKIWDKIYHLAKLLEKYPQIPSASVILAGVIGQDYYIVQKMIDGKAAGNRKRENGKIIDDWTTGFKAYEKQIEKVASKLHQIKINGAGWIKIKNGKIQGKYKNWPTFLEKEMRLWIDSIKQRERSSALAKKLQNFFEKNKKYLQYQNSSLVHNDLINPGNILVKNRKLKGLIDWEWALAGDPAWEFSFNNRYSLKEYFKNLPKITEADKKAFRRRAKIYEKIYLIWALHAHTKDKDTKLYDSIRKRVSEEIK